MATNPSTVELPLTLRVSKEAQEKLIERAAASGTDLAAYISTVVEQMVRGAVPLEQISGDVYQRFLRTGTSDEQLSQELEQAKHQARSDRRTRRAS